VSAASRGREIAQLKCEGLGVRVKSWCWRGCALKIGVRNGRARDVIGQPRGRTRVIGSKPQRLYAYEEGDISRDLLLRSSPQRSLAFHDLPYSFQTTKELDALDGTMLDENLPSALLRPTSTSRHH
jgi:hypothetical protein